MAIYNREDEYIKLLSEREHTVKELSRKLFISEPTVRRDVLVLKDKNIVECKRGRVTLKLATPDARVPMFLRNLAHTDEKDAMARKCAAEIKDGFTVMLDASTSAYCVVPYLREIKNLFVINYAVALNNVGDAVNAVARRNRKAFISKMLVNLCVLKVGAIICPRCITDRAVNLKNGWRIACCHSGCEG